MSSEIKACQNCKQNFTIEPEDFEFYEKIKVPAPTFCPECRLIRRIAWRNESNLYRRRDSLTGKLIFSTISDSSPVKVYERDFWWSDGWDPTVYGRNYDFSRPFFEQLKELLGEVPWFSRSVINLVNSNYCGNAAGLKNCYLIFNANEDEDCAYGVSVDYSKDCFDNYKVRNSELCHGNSALNKCYRTFFSSHCFNCQDVYFSQNLNNCHNCFGCAGLRNKEYYIFNESYSKDDYFKKLEQFNLGSYKNKLELEEKAKNFWLKFPHKFSHGTHSSNVSGDYIDNSKNIFNSFTIFEAENCKYCFDLSVPTTKDSYDYSIYGENAELIYEAIQVGMGAYNVKFCCRSYPNCRDFEYSMMCSSSSNLFACIGLRNKQYCILNKQYTKEEYEQLVPKIIEHMNNMPYIDKKGRIYKYGEFFPPELSPFSYNETIAQEYFPLTKEQAIEQGYSWKDPEERNITITIKSEELPDHIKDVKDDILTQVIECQHNNQNCNEQCTTAFKIIPQELEFYKKMNLPLPRLCPNCRHYQRIKQRNPLKLWHRQCQCNGLTGNNPNNPNIYQNTITHTHGTEPCPNEFETTYSPDRKEIVYCEACYNQEVA